MQFNAWAAQLQGIVATLVTLVSDLTGLGIAPRTPVPITMSLVTNTV